MGIEGHLKISISTDSGQVDLVRIESSRPVHASRIFQGRNIEDALKTVPMLFAICGTAQACAGVRACEQALGVRAVPRVESLRDSLVRMETVREHLWRILLDWPVFLGEEPEKSGMTDMLTLQRDYRQSVTGGYEPFLPPGDAYQPGPVPDGLLQKVALILEQAVFGMSPNRWLDINHLDKLEDWAESGVTVAARLVNHLLRAEWCEVGVCDVEALPFLNEEELHKMMQDDDFVLQPQWHGQCHETTSFTRVDSPLLRQLRIRYGNGLLVRVAARLTEIAQLSENLLPEMREGDCEEQVSAQNPGIGQVAAARGELLHRVQLKGEQITGYQILAPTEWNFHPQGVVAKSLATLFGDRKKMEQQARLLINAIDPCVGYELSFV